MGKIWEFYENLNEIVCVSDIDTYEIAYMNPKACEVYGYASLEQVKGKKCYEVSQNKIAPCEFCTNQYLKKGEFYEWQFFNPIIGKNYSSKVALVEEDGKCYRMELAFDMTIQEEQRKTIQDFTNNESMVNEGLKIALAEATPERSIEALLDYLGKHLQSERVYIFEENEEGSLDNTYEWCGAEVEPQKENLQKVPFEVVSLWYDTFQKNENVIIKDVEEIKEIIPLTYEYLKPHNIHSLVVSPIIDNDKVIGFYGVDNPPGEFLNHISTLFWIVGHFIGSLLKRRDLVKSLERMSFYDQLTKLGNRHAMEAYQSNIETDKSIGIIYCDVMGLKRVNDTQGHHEGDELLLRACECLKKHFDKETLFRIGGDEFLVILAGVSKEETIKRIEQLKLDMVDEDARMALGFVWKSSFEMEFERLLREADNRMYEDKRRYYEMLLG